MEVFGDLAGLGTWVLPERVETESELDVLIRLGVPLTQGWVLAHVSVDGHDPRPPAPLRPVSHATSRVPGHSVSRSCWALRSDRVART